MSDGEVSGVKVYDLVCVLRVYSFSERGEIGDGCLRSMKTLYVV